MENKKGKIKNVLIIILVLLVLSLCGYILYTKNIEKKDNQSASKVEQKQSEKQKIDNSNKTDNQINDNENVTNEKKINMIFDDLVGAYYQEKTFPLDADNTCTAYAKLNLKNDGTYYYEASGSCHGGTIASGNYSLGINKIYLYNDRCKPIVDVPPNNNKCTYPNCNDIIELKYKNGVLIATNGVELELSKQ